MFEDETLFGADWANDTYVLPRDVPAIQVSPDEMGRIRMGVIIKLPEGAEVQDCGEGFDDRTRKVWWHGGFYYIFKDDMERSTASRKNMSAAG